MGNCIFHGVYPAICLPAGRPERCHYQPVVGTPCALPLDPDTHIWQCHDRNLVTPVAPEAEGHGTDAAIKSFHGDGRIRKRVPVLKAVTAILTISTGGSAGREGPAAQISAGFGSVVADMLGLSPKERRIALTTGIGAGIGTIFKAPLGGAVLAAEVLYTRDFESDAIIPAFMASVIGYAIFGFFEGYAPIFSLTPLTWTLWQIPLFIVLGILCAAFGLLYIFVFYGSRDWFAKVFKRYNLPLY